MLPWPGHVQFGQLMRPVFDAYNQSVSASNGSALDQAVMNWARDYLSLIALRPGRYTYIMPGSRV